MNSQNANSVWTDNIQLGGQIITTCTSEGMIQSCTTENSCPGTQTCTDNNWGICVDNEGDGCSQKSCSENYVEGMYCLTDSECSGRTKCFEGEWICEDEPNDACSDTCEMSETRNCMNAPNCQGIKNCLDDNTWSECIDIPGDNCNEVVDDAPYVCYEGQIGSGIQ